METKIQRGEETRPRKLIYFGTLIQFYFRLWRRRDVLVLEKTIFTRFILNYRTNCGRSFIDCKDHCKLQKILSIHQPYLMET
jgi:hypothetical protein